MSNQASLFPVPEITITSQRKKTIGLTPSHQLEYLKEYRKKNKDKIKAYNNRGDVKQRRKLYYASYNHGITPEWYTAQLEKQENKCAICGRDFSQIPARQIHIDHDHKTGLVRDILCNGCNMALGAIDEDIEIAEKIIEYLKKHKAYSK